MTTRFGLEPVLANGKLPHLERFPLDTTAAIFSGDAVKLNASGKIVPCAGTEPLDAPIGVFVSGFYVRADGTPVEDMTVPAGTTNPTGATYNGLDGPGALVITDPDQIYKIRSSASTPAISQSDVGKFYGVDVGTAGSTLYKRSNDILAAAASTSNEAYLQVVAVPDLTDPNDAASASPALGRVVYVRFAKHAYRKEAPANTFAMSALIADADEVTSISLLGTVTKNSLMTHIAVAIDPLNTGVPLTADMTFIVRRVSGTAADLQTVTAKFGAPAYGTFPLPSFGSAATPSGIAVTSQVFVLTTPIAVSAGDILTVRSGGEGTYTPSLPVAVTAFFV